MDYQGYHFALPKMKNQAMRATQRAEIDGGQGLLPDQVNDRKRVIGSEAVIGDVSGCAVRGSDDLVRIVANGNTRHGLEAVGIDDG